MIKQGGGLAISDSSREVRRSGGTSGALASTHRRIDALTSETTKHLGSTTSTSCVLASPHGFRLLPAVRQGLARSARPHG